MSLNFPQMLNFAQRDASPLLGGTPNIPDTRTQLPGHRAGSPAAKKTPSDKTKSAFGHFFDWRCILRSIILIISILASTSFSSPILSSTWAQRPLLTVALITMVPCSGFRRIALHARHRTLGMIPLCWFSKQNTTETSAKPKLNDDNIFFCSIPKMARFSEFIKTKVDRILRQARVWW